MFPFCRNRLGSNLLFTFHVGYFYEKRDIKFPLSEKGVKNGTPFCHKFMKCNILREYNIRICEKTIWLK